jgi:hypothetical protein
MVKPIISYPERGLDIQLPGVEVVVDGARVEIYMLDSVGERIEGGTFDLNQFTAWVLKFYNHNY